MKKNVFAKREESKLACYPECRKGRMKSKEYQKPALTAIEIIAGQQVLTVSGFDFEEGAEVGGDTDPNNPRPWI